MSLSDSQHLWERNTATITEECKGDTASVGANLQINTTWATSSVGHLEKSRKKRRSEQLLSILYDMYHVTLLAELWQSRISSFTSPVGAFPEISLTFFVTIKLLLEKAIAPFSFCYFLENPEGKLLKKTRSNAGIFSY